MHIMNVYIQSKTSIYSLPYDSQILLHTGYEKIYVKNPYLAKQRDFFSEPYKDFRQFGE